MAEELIEGLSTAAVIADKGYDSNDFIATIQQQGAEAVIPSRRNRKEQRTVCRFAHPTLVIVNTL